MPLDVNKIKNTAAKLAEEAATAANDIAEQAKPAVERASAKVDEFAEKGRPLVEKAEREVKDAVNSITGKGKGGANNEGKSSGGGAF